MSRVAITGIGVVSCLGNDVAAVEEALRHGRSGVGVDPERRQRGFRSPLTGMIRDFDPGRVLPRKQRKTMPDFAVWAVAATQEALRDAGLDPADIRNEETGLIFGCDSSAAATIEQVDRLRECGETTSLGSGLVFRSMTSTITMNLNTLLGTRGACWSISSACSSGGHAVGQAADLIALGRQTRMICGAAQEITWESMCSFDGLGAFSTRVEEPAAASRPFDRDRDGLVPSGGAAVLVLEAFEAARGRGAPILGEVAGYAFSSDGVHISVPSGEGIERCMRRALAAAGLGPGDIDYISAHATSTPAGDAVEAESIAAVFGPKTPPVVSLKSMTGHELWMSGASQAVYGTIMARGGFLAPSINFRAPDAASSKLTILTESAPRSPRRMLCNAAGFGGTNACLVVRFDG